MVLLLTIPQASAPLNHHLLLPTARHPAVLVAEPALLAGIVTGHLQAQSQHKS
jgi:hypothetical protein